MPEYKSTMQMADRSASALADVRAFLRGGLMTAGLRAEALSVVRRVVCWVSSGTRTPLRKCDGHVSPCDACAGGCENFHCR
jgi:hypothetical protein